MNNIANKPSSLIWRLKKFFIRKRGGITLEELTKNKKKDSDKIAAQLKESAKNLETNFETIASYCEEKRRLFSSCSNSNLSGDKMHIYSFHSIIESIKNVCTSSAKNLSQVFESYPNEITKISYQNLLGTTDGIKYKKLENKVNEALGKINKQK